MCCAYAKLSWSDRSYRYHACNTHFVCDTYCLCGIHFLWHCICDSNFVCETHFAPDSVWVRSRCDCIHVLKTLTGGVPGLKGVCVWRGVRGGGGEGVGGVHFCRSQRVKKPRSKPLVFCIKKIVNTGYDCEYKQQWCCKTSSHLIDLIHLIEVRWKCHLSLNCWSREKKTVNTAVCVRQWSMTLWPMTQYDIVTYDTIVYDHFQL